MHFSHLSAMALFALLLATVFACLGVRSKEARVRHAVLSFLLFMGVAIGIAWLLYPLSR